MASESPVPAPAAPPWREPVRGGYPPRHLLALPGIDQLRLMLAGEVPAPPLSRLTGASLTAVAEGTASFRMPLTEWLATPQGAISIGPLTVPADAAVACAIQTALPPATPFSTSELSLRLLAPAHPGGVVTAVGRLIQVRRRIGLAEVTVADEQDRLVAHGSSLCFMQPAITAEPAVGGTDAKTALGDPNAETVTSAPDGMPDPYLRPAAGAILSEEVWRAHSGLEILNAQLAGRLPPPPIHYLTGLTIEAAEEGGVAFSMPASEWLCAPAAARVQGGFVATLAEAALSASVQARLPAGTALAAVDLKVSYLRPLPADGRRATASGEVVHLGRRMAVARAEVRDADARPVAIANGSAMVLPGRPASLRDGTS